MEMNYNIEIVDTIELGNGEYRLVKQTYSDGKIVWDVVIADFHSNQHYTITRRRSGNLGDSGIDSVAYWKTKGKAMDIWNGIKAYDKYFEDKVKEEDGE